MIHYSDKREHNDLDFVKGIFEGETSSASDDETFVVDKELIDNDKEGNITQSENIGFDDFWYNFCIVPVIHDINDDVEIKEDGASNNQGSLDRSIDDESSEGCT